MTASLIQRCLQSGLATLLLALSIASPAQDKPMAPAPATTPAAAMTPAIATSAPADATTKPARKRHVVRRKPAAICQALDDPWENMCVVRKKAEIACNDLSAPSKKVKMVKKGRGKVNAPMPAMGNPRQECVDAYMKNV